MQQGTQYYICTHSADYARVCRWIFSQDIPAEFHLNRVRFWVQQGKLFTEFQMLYSHCCDLVDLNADLLQGAAK